MFQNVLTLFLVEMTFEVQNKMLKLSVEELEIKSESKIKTELSDEELDTKSESQFKIEPSQERLKTKSEKLVSQIFFAAICFTFSSFVVSCTY